MAGSQRRFGPGGTGWIVKKNGSMRASGIYGTQAEAARAAQDMVRIKSGTVRIEPTGKVTVLTGASPHGQGQETTFPQLVADPLVETLGKASYLK